MRWSITPKDGMVMPAVRVRRLLPLLRRFFQGHRSLSSFRGLRPSPVRLPRISHSIVSCALMRGTSGGIPGRHSISSAPPQR